MKIQYLGHSCFRIEFANGVSAVTDPYRAGSFGGSFRYSPVGVSADIVTASHSHEDHFDASAVTGAPKALRMAGLHEHKGVKVLGVATHHDQKGGSQRGANVVFVFEADGLRVAHLGDLGHVLKSEQTAGIGRVDVVLAPVGGYFTIDAAEALECVKALKARIAIPMHFKTAKVDFPIAGPEAFLAAAGTSRRIGSSSAKIDAGALPGSLEAWLLDPAR